jgi:hypothetical protein
MHGSSGERKGGRVELNALLQDIQTVAVDAVAVGFFEDVRPLKGGAGAFDWLLCGDLSRLVIEGRVRGALGEVALLTTAGKAPAKKVFLFGLGRASGCSSETLRVASRTVTATMAAAGVRSAALDFFPLQGEISDQMLAAVREGIREGAGEVPMSLTLVAPDASRLERMSHTLRG